MKHLKIHLLFFYLLLTGLAVICFFWRKEATTKASYYPISAENLFLPDEAFKPYLAPLQVPKEPSRINHVDTSANWLQKVQQNIQQSEYYIRYQDEAGAFQCPNRKHNFRASFKPGNFSLQPRVDSLEKWHFSLQLKAIRFDHRQFYEPDSLAILSASANELNIHHHQQLFNEQYVNTEAGVRQNFIIEQAPDIKSNRLTVELNICGTLKAELKQHKRIHFYEQKPYGKEDRIIYRDLKCWDKNGQELISYIDLDDKTLHLAVNTENAEYPITIDPISTTASSQLESGQASSNFGYSAASAGDVNGDGYSDIIVGAWQYDNGSSTEGAAFVYHGSSTGIGSTIQLQLEGNQVNAYYAQSLASAGDVNGDGYSDIIIGAFGYDNGSSEEGAAFLYHGSASGISSTIQIQLESNQASAYLGSSVACAGDVNADGYSDVIIGAYFYQNGTPSEGAAFVYHGSSSGISSTIQTQLEINQGSSYFGSSVACAGDVNGDGYSDVIVGAYDYSNGSTEEGGVFVYHGSASGITTTIQTQLEKNQNYAKFGYSVAGAGDVNGDGYSDVIVGAEIYDNGSTDEGGAFVYHGSASGITTTIQTQLEINQISGFFGTSVACAGDVNGDGYADVIVGALVYDNGQSDEGAAFVYHGSSTGISTTVQSQLECNQASAYFGACVASAGDVNGDGYSDVLVGADNYDNGTSDEGAVFVYHGSASGITTTLQTQIESSQDTAYLGTTVACAGDVNGDGYSDIIVSAPMYDNGQSDEGAVFIYHGSASGITTTVQTQLENNVANVYFGDSVAGAGDVNGDGYSDVIVGCIYFANGQSSEGAAFVYHGSSSGITTTKQIQLEVNQGVAYLGKSVAGAGDVNGDGYSDVIVGANLYDNGQSDEGGAFVFHGSSSGITSTIQTQLECNSASANFGYSVSSAGDVNGDGYSDVIVGAINFANGNGNEGSVFVFHGSASGITTTIQTRMESNQTNAYLGCSVACAGDVNGDGYSDVIAGSYNYDSGQSDEGVAFVYHGSASGVTTTIQTQLESNQASANFGFSVASAGDVNGDGYSDVIVGAYLYDNGQSDEGVVFIYHGSSSGIGTTVKTQLEVNQTMVHFGKSVSGAGDVNGDGFNDVIAGAKNYDNGNTDEGAVFVYHSNETSSENLRNNLKLYNTDLSSNISQSNITAATFGIGLYEKSFLGKQKAKMYWEAKAQANSFTGSPISTSVSSTSSQGSYTALSTGTELTNAVTKLSLATHVRARVKYDPVTSLTGQVYSPWRYSANYLMGGSFMNATPLPAELLYFKEVCQSEGTQLQWATQTETNNDYFDLEYSKDGIFWNNIFTVKGKGNSNVLCEYNFLHPELNPDVSYYRLSQVDFNGEAQSYPIISSQCDGDLDDILIYPNPFNQVIKIKVQHKVASRLTLDVLNSLGQNLMTFQWSERELDEMPYFEINTSKLVPGTYIFRFNIGIQVDTRNLMKVND